ncbi:unnamed protein product [Durusdinium trenchii]|uniref:Uncharacterized protein n=1 Tax=Durusdinium trenchii TaxID=1381693 RepID=A0ABP0J999_9DINO
MVFSTEKASRPSLSACLQYRVRRRVGLNVPEIDVRNKDRQGGWTSGWTSGVELKIDEGPDAYVTDRATGRFAALILPESGRFDSLKPNRLRIMVSTCYHAKLQLRLNFPFDEQSLPIDFVMPSEKVLGDQQRAFVFRQCDLAPLAYHLDEWTVQGTHHKVGFHEGMSQAAMYVKVKRNSKYYVVSVLGVMLGISSLVFTVRVAETDRFRACHFWVSELK